MSDQNQWPKPGESNGSTNGQQHDGRSGAQQPPQSAPSSGAQDPWSRSGQGTSAQGVGSAPYGQPSQGNPYGQQAQGNPYGQSQSGQQGNPYGQSQPGQQGNPYGQSQPGQQGNPYGQSQPGQQGNPYAASGPQHNPYAPQQGGNPYAAPYATGGYQPYAQRPKTNTLAILSIVFAYAGIIIWPVVILTSPAGAIMGHIALGKIKQTGEGGRGLALAGIIGGWVLTGLYVLFAILFIALIASTGGGYSDPYDYDPSAFVG
ncbi:hypothetical protein DEJ23_08020 [Curtobacterium sp. MCSS17_008]|uniref:DUF4190 domain-containing protein n=1 Tax=Curtobacterium sp. MCSS17_008 TaxID=2175647 RepID=UPI000DA71D76|nr:DUF4190 domain-containing protein [Curtobacterium sp. MCSS17_008]PZF57416.1 hypothetical protein DEJ23_08020 [Curtobacterium sp. MCSS17_008]